MSDLKSNFYNWLNTSLHSPFDSLQDKFKFEDKLENLKSSSNFELTEYKIQSADDSDLRYLYFSKPENTRLKFLIHGSGSNFYKRDRSLFLLEKGFNVVLVSYRGHSGNPWSKREEPLSYGQLKFDEFIVNLDMVPEGEHLQEAIIDDVYRVLLDSKSRFNFNSENIFLEGSSLGGSIALHLLSRFAQEFSDEAIASLLLKATPIDMLTDQESSLRNELSEFGLDFDEALPLVSDSWNQRDALANININELKLVHGDQDDVVPLSHSDEFEEIFKALKTEKIIVPGEAHAGFDLSKYEIY
ncbi:MAG: alpha/beta hydrolase fold domain-containing protein [Candidatus Caenarcaniphilales bacterium]|nr:alpha/beta hydrolase fold domain-containing protein [Candidatus Caenarcaniphilales bacterium]